MKVHLSQSGNINFVAHTESGHEISMDGSPDNGGENKGARPMEVVLAGLGGCSAIDVIHILEKSRVPVTDCTIDIDAQRADAIPSVFTHIRIHYTVTGSNLNPKKVKRAVDLSMEKYCSVTRMLEQSVDIVADFSIVEA